MSRDILASLRAATDRHKAPGADDEWIRQHAHYEDRARELTRARLAQLGVGLLNNPRPLEVNLLRSVIHRLAVIYSRPPTRWLTRPSGARYAESTAAHRNMTAVLERAQYDLAWRLVDQLRALLRQVVIRFYPSDARGSVVVRIFEPYNVLRDPDPGAPDQLDQDRAFALRLSTEPEVWEIWERTADGWRSVRVGPDGEPLGVQPFGELEGLLSPYAELPVQIVYDEYTGGRAWLAPRCSRLSWSETLTALANDLWELVVQEAHSQKAITTDDASAVPRQAGPGSTWVLPTGASAQILAHNPQIRGALDVFDRFAHMWLLSEDLPADAFDRSRQVLTGASLKVAQGPLRARRRDMVPLAQGDEAQAFRRLRAVHNLHADEAAGWLPALPEDAGVEVELADLDAPVDARDLLDAGAKGLALGTVSTIDLIQAQHNVSRRQAIEIYERVSADAESYPTLVGNPGSVQEGPKAAGVPASEDGRADAQTEDEGPDASRPPGADSATSALAVA